MAPVTRWGPPLDGARRSMAPAARRCPPLDADEKDASKLQSFIVTAIAFMECFEKCQSYLVANCIKDVGKEFKEEAKHAHEVIVKHITQAALQLRPKHFLKCPDGLQC